jgi:hypothetical protein
MRKIVLTAIVVSLLQNLIAEAKQKPANSFSFDLVDSRNVIYRDLNKDLVLRVVKDEMGWNVKVTRKPINQQSSWNLLYHSLKWHGPYPSEVYAWHITERYFRNERTLNVRGYPYEVRIVLTNPMVEGEGSQARFKSGRVRISWRRKLRGHAPPNNAMQPTRG